ncbi:MAG: glutathione S-transferase family protein [Rhizomicrobium sp.]|jgi:glutathione S-transferase
MKAKIIGGPASPYVRKVIAALHIKGIDFSIDPIVPFYGNDEFGRISPLRRIPVYIDDRVTLCDSSVIVQYLEDRWPQKSLYPQDVAARAHARWLEEYGDTRIGDVFIWKLFFDAVISPGIFGTERHPEQRAAVLAKDLPEVMDYLESQMPKDGFLCGAFSIAELSLAPHFSNLAWARVELDWNRWPKTGAWLKRVNAESTLGELAKAGVQLLRLPPPQHRDKLIELGFDVATETVGAEKPRRGIMLP